MPEKSQPNQIPSTDQVNNWLEHDLELIKGGAVIDHLGHLSITGDQYDSLAQQGGSDTVSNEVSSNPDVQAEVMTPERLKEIVDTSVYQANPYIAGRESVKHNGINGDAYAPIFEDMYIEAGVPEKPFNDAGVSELVTIAKSSRFKLNKDVPLDVHTWPSEPYEDEPVYGIHYTTLTAGLEEVEDPTAPRGVRHLQKYPYRENRGHRESLMNMSEEEVAQLEDWQKRSRESDLQPDAGRLCDFRYTMLLPETLAQELGAAMKANPQLVRELGDILVLDREGIRQSNSRANGHDWAKWKPPYAQWREVNGGIDRMAFRTASDQTLEQSEVVEY